MSTNFSNTVPAAPSGGTNIQWQTDGSGNISGYVSSVGKSLFSKTYYTTAQRGLSSVYQNTTGQPIIVYGWVVSGGNTITAVCDSSASPSTVVLEQDSQNGYGANFMFMVPNNYYYEITASGGTAEVWVELELLSGSVTFSGELSGSRALSTVYQNTSANAILVVADISGLSAGTTIEAISDTSSSPSNVVWLSEGAATGKQTIFFLVPAGHYYEITASGGAVAHWNEYTFPFNATKTGDYKTAPVARTLITGALSPSGVQINTRTGTDLFVIISAQPSTTGSLLVDSSFCNPPGLTPYDDTTMSNTNSQNMACALFVMLGEFYSARIDGGSPVLEHWWEYALI